MRRTASVMASALLVAVTLTGCQLYEEHVCSEGEYPVYAVSNPNGGMCVTDGARSPEGFAAYPSKRVPEVVGDKYDRWPLAADYPWPDEVSPRAPR